MLFNLVDYELVLSLVIVLLLLIFQLRFSIKNAFRNLFIYLNFLLLLEILSTIVLFNSQNIDLALIAAKSRFIAQCFIPATLFHFSKNFSVLRIHPKFNFQNILIFLIATGIALTGLGSYSITGIQLNNFGNRIEFGPFYLFYILFSNIVFYLIFVELISRFRETRRKEEIRKFKEVTAILLPLLYATAIFLYQLPYFGVFHPIIYSGYLILSITLFYGAIRFYFIDVEEIIPILNPHAFMGAILVFFGFLVFKLPKHLWQTLAAAGIFLAFIGTSFLITKGINRLSRNFNYQLEQNRENQLIMRFNEIMTIINKSKLWEYVAHFFKENFPITKIAIIAYKYDISPYKVEFAEGYNPEKLHQFISNHTSPLMEVIEENKTIINKFEHSPNSMLFKVLNDLNIYLVVPLVIQGKIQAIIFLGGDRKYCRFTIRQINILEIVATQISYALKNILTIEETVQSQKMAELGRFASQIAHDFQSFITLVKLETKENPRLRQHAIYMERLVRDLLNYARPQDLKLTPVDINNLLDMSLDLVDIPPHIMVEKHFSTNLPRIYVDVNQMQRVFTNLFDNSIRAMSRNQKVGRLKITTRPLRPISVVKRNLWIYIEILDEGEGIPEEFLNRIFDPFFTTYKDCGGTGMGLAIVRQIILRHQGHIDVTSKPGKGTIFNIRLPFIASSQ